MSTKPYQQHPWCSDISCDEEWAVRIAPLRLGLDDWLGMPLRKECFAGLRSVKRKTHSLQLKRVFHKCPTRAIEKMNRSKGLVLVIEDDRHIAALVRTYLEQEGFQAMVTYDGEAGLELARRFNPSLVILDLMLPKLDGWEVCRRLRSASEVPILMLTARGEEIDRLLGFALAADDYVVKPFSPRELVERVKAILRRLQPERRYGRQPLRHGALVLDMDSHQATLHGDPLALTPIEFRLLEALMTYPGRALSREILLNHMKTHGDIVVDRVVDVHVGKLRRKIEADATHPRYIETVRGIGYRLNPAASDLP